MSKEKIVYEYRSVSPSKMTSAGASLIAIVSGKGGSGKTMIAVSVAESLASFGKSVILVDGDMATGGLTNYLTLIEYSYPSIGVSDVVKNIMVEGNISQIISDEEIVGYPKAESQSWRRDNNVGLVVTGDQRRVIDDRECQNEAISTIVKNIRQRADYIIIDCRGGIDEHSVEICKMVDNVFLIVETDATSIRSSDHLVTVLNDANLKGKICGFILNKVMENPKSTARMVSSLTGIRYLGAIPFDIEATRAYLQGLIPQENTLFMQQSMVIVSNMFPHLKIKSRYKELDPNTFGTMTMQGTDSRIGGIILIIASVYVTVSFSLWLGFNNVEYYPYRNVIIVATMALYNIVIAASISDHLKRKLGRLVRRIFTMGNIKGR